ncbi:C6 finger domain protein [Cladophialophora carrionii]|uniref:C6 finger domain protein n=1 Tax=Cladophialophora carrionii TaxID=86049 RepID=A0A1C1D2A1_9EURO|nr:C6 finger domain protein [Cladophialophora carrionii]
MTPTFPTSDTSDPALNMQHLELLHQFVTSTYRTFNDNDEVREVWRTSIVWMALAHPYLMYELLAISALHLAYCRPESSPWYYTTSTELQTQALNSFNSIQRAVDASNCAPVLMFTSLLAVHVLADPSRTVGLGTSQYLDHVIHCIMLMRNVQKLVIRDWYDHLKKSELGPIFGVTQPEKPYQIPQPCLDLAKLIEHSDLGDQAKEAYNSAIERLHWLYAVSNVPNENYTTVRWLLAWPIQLSGDYQDKLNQRRPEALVILAYFAVMLRFYKGCWVVGDSGKFLIESISAHLGPHWREWMEWPLSFLTDSSDTG